MTRRQVSKRRRGSDEVLGDIDEASQNTTSYEPRELRKQITRASIHSLRGEFRGKGLMKVLRAEKKLEREI